MKKAGGGHTRHGLPFLFRVKMLIFKDNNVVSWAPNLGELLLISHHRALTHTGAGGPAANHGARRMEFPKLSFLKVSRNKALNIRLVTPVFEKSLRLQS